ncbi:methionyl-tRNA formyltransferase [Actinotalea sp. M2MS4P-6]|uniref:methionyl-tRNA formyltransferase n=1 Tax=Actinotalea sp. M2MS4P-6 TaxID=2983762 RepID=UPI0021E3A018|nr:methionyl-tRNA formyltransferase [Actinotalea sp. M2MS4P-6]MCV2394603.1 methionyl-tRNA formyltransferase [Actinotalea sp. M2MS4P-6]
MRLLFAGTPEVALPSLARLLGGEHEVVAVLTRPDAPAGRGRRLVPSPVRQAAESAGVAVLTPATLRDAAVRSDLEALDLDLGVLVAYGGLVPADLLDLPRHGWVNLHFSVLPAWRGAAPVQHALLHGDEVTGATTFRLKAGPVDTGPVYGTLTETVRPRDTSGDLLGRLADAGAGLLATTVDGIAAGALAPQPQGEDGVSLAPRLTADDARVRWDHPAIAVDRRVRACTPSPGAWTTDPAGERLKVGPVRPRSDAEPLAPGAVSVGRHEVLVGTATVPVELGAVAPAGRRMMPAADWARGARLTPDTRLGGGEPQADA